MGARLGAARGARRAPVAAAVLVTLWMGCASTGPDSGVVHVVRPGETIYRISRFYGVSTQSVIEANRVRDVSKVAIGERLWIPGAHRSPPARNLAAVVAPPRSRGDRAVARRESNLAFSWPLTGRVSSGFGWRHGRKHEGIDIPARRGTTIHAAEAGRVIHAGGELGDYGKVVIVKHAGHYSTVYAHNRKNLVHKGDFVEKGEAIAQVGKSGNASGPHLHFEIRRDRRAENPMDYLP